MTRDTDTWGILEGYVDAFGEPRSTPPATRRALAAAMGTPSWPDELPSGSTTCAPPPPGLRFGLAAQLYAARSEASWGIGDLADLARLGRWAQGRGAAVVLVNPIDAPLPGTPREPSPYLPATRRFRDPIYLRPDLVPGADETGGAVEALGDEARGLDADPVIDRDRVWELKEAALREIWRAAPKAGREPGLGAFRRRVGEPLRRFAAWRALAGRHGPDWRTWPDRLSDPATGTAVGLETAADEMAFHAWVQWLCDRQLARAGSTVPLVRDLPVGFHPGGFDAWAWQHLLADGVSVGAPPDRLGPHGQDWSLPAFVPHRLARASFEPWRTTLRSSLRHAGGLRIDHVLGLFRLFWIPPGAAPADGAYVAQPTGALMELLARASRDAGAFVVGEDLGTVGEEVRDTLLERGLLRTLVMWFEDRAVQRWPRQALAMISTHDLPTVAGVWTGADLAELEALGLEPDADWHRGIRAELAAAAGLSPEADATEAVVAAHRHLGTSASRLVLAQLEDLCVSERRANVPGTTAPLRDNWSRALPLPLDDLVTDPTASRILEALRAGRSQADEQRHREA